MLPVRRVFCSIQVRWGDKAKSEAIKHEVDEYMEFVELWFKRMESEGRQAERIVFIATEESQVWVDLKLR